MTSRPRTAVDFREDKNLIIHLTVTGRCNARCRGCINSTITALTNRRRDAVATFVDSVPERDASIIQRLAGRRPGRQVTVCFYGGEPFLAADKMVEVWKLLRASPHRHRIRYMVYTNGEFFADALRRYPKFMKDVWLYSVSVDGDRRQHDRARPGTNLDNIELNLQALRRIRPTHVLMWSTLREEQSLLNCFREFEKLHQDHLVTSFYWHWPEIVEPFVDFASYARNYRDELDTIMDSYVRRFKEGKILPIIHLNELILYLITGKQRQHSACAIETLKNYDIVGGKIYYCVDLPASLGSIEENRDGGSLVKYKVRLGCFDCGVHPYCGGRCPVQGLYGSLKRTRQYCRLMRLHVQVVQNRLGDIRAIMAKHRISPQRLYDHSAFLARFTDVTP